MLVLVSAQSKTLLTLWLQVSVDETHQMEKFQGANDFRNVESRTALWQTLVWIAKSLQCSKKLSPSAVFRDKVNVTGCLERIIQRYNKGMVGSDLGEFFMVPC